MSRRYLTIREAESCLNRGKPIECFIGACGTDDEPGIEWFSISKETDSFIVSIYQSADLGDENHIDIYGFGPLNEDLEFEDPTETVKAQIFEDILDILSKKYNQGTFNLVNQFIVQDEYCDFVKRGRS
jgi:hypothetical protein